MPDASDLNDEVTNAAVKPQSASIDGNSVSQVSIDDKIKAADRAAGREATAADRPGLGIRFQTFKPYYP